MLILAEIKQDRYLLHMTEEKLDLLSHLNKEYRETHKRFWLKDILTGQDQPIPLNPLYIFVFGDTEQYTSGDCTFYKLEG